MGKLDVMHPVKERQRLERKVRNERLARFGYASYRQYLLSNNWRSLRRAYFDDDYTPKRCLCGEAEVGNLRLHHKTYARIGAELFGDLQPLCDLCHRDVHRMTDLGLAPYDLEDYKDPNRRQKYAEERKADLVRRGEEVVSDDPYNPENWRNDSELRQIASVDRRVHARRLARAIRRMA